MYARTNISYRNPRVETSHTSCCMQNGMVGKMPALKSSGNAKCAHQVKKHVINGRRTGQDWTLMCFFVFRVNFHLRADPQTTTSKYNNTAPTRREVHIYGGWLTARENEPNSEPSGPFNPLTRHIGTEHAYLHSNKWPPRRSWSFSQSLLTVFASFAFLENVFDRRYLCLWMQSLEVTPLYGICEVCVRSRWSNHDDDDDAVGGVGIDVWSIELLKEKHVACSIHPAVVAHM